MSNTVNLKFIGPQHYREITADDWSSAGITGQDPIKVSGENAFVRANDFTTSRVVALTEDAADFLLATEPDLWEKTDEEAGISPIKTRAAEAQALLEAGAEKAQEEIQEQVPAGNIATVTGWVQSDPDRARAALAVELAKGEDQRTTLVDHLNGILDAAGANEEISDEDESDEDDEDEDDE